MKLVVDEIGLSGLHGWTGEDFAANPEVIVALLAIATEAQAVRGEHPALDGALTGLISVLPPAGGADVDA